MQNEPIIIIARVSEENRRTKIAGKIRRGGSAEGRKTVFERYTQLTGGMKVRMVQWRVADRSCHELFDTEWITKVHGKRSQRSACVRDRFRVLGSTAREERAQLSHIRSPSAAHSWHESRHLTAAEIIYPMVSGTVINGSCRGKKDPRLNSIPFRLLHKNYKNRRTLITCIDFVDFLSSI